MTYCQINRVKSSPYVRGSVLLLSILLILTACAGGTKLTKKDRASVRSVSFCRDVTCKRDMYYKGLSDSLLGGTLGPVGYLAGTQVKKKPKEMLKDVMRKNEIEVGKIVREQFEVKLKDSGLFSSIIPNGGDAVFRLSILNYGFFNGASGWSNKLYPMLLLEGTLVKSDGSVLWKKISRVPWQNEKKRITPHTLNEYLANPEFIREVFTTVAQIHTKYLINNMLAKR